MSIDAVKYLMENAGTGWLATCVNGQAHLRPMSAWQWYGRHLIFATFRNSEKVMQLQHNAGVELAFAAPDWSHIRITGKMRVVEDSRAAELLYEANPPIQQLFESPRDPKLAVLHLTIESIRLFSMDSRQYQDIELPQE